MIDVNSISSGTYMSILYRLFFVRWWWILLLPVALCLALIAVDTRFAFVALIVAMAMVILSFPLLYYFALTQESRWSILEKTVTITDEGLQLDFTNEKMRQHIILWREIASSTALNHCLVLRLKKNRYTFLAIPLDAFSGEDDLRQFVVTIRERIN
ncbi:MAG: hypothetical protein J6X22_01415 [Muribaculaceae bacterium]|nr:hypothetical protein [Muribaculaceae bacterium]